ncbi:hypothetical protein [Bacillus marasmi]|uniref:hypothetical protein n=1 Tax=Bacillus marasmi TaxID=1926279 RepID=UPI0011CBE412|nr:hypothetical protein [Bacillus marasmi]
MNAMMIEEITKLVLQKLEEHSDYTPEKQHHQQKWTDKVQQRALSDEEIREWGIISQKMGDTNKGHSVNRHFITQSLNQEELQQWEVVASKIRKKSSESSIQREQQVKFYSTHY